MFDREVTSEQVEALRIAALYDQCLLGDVRIGVVFPAIRRQRFAFYHKGGLLFEHTRTGGASSPWRFRTNVKFGLVPAGSPMYVGESELSSLKLQSDFVQSYAQIKKNVDRLKEPERAGVGDVCKCASCAKKTRGQIVVLDVEVGLRNEAETTTDRIDFVLLDTTSGELTFFEAKGTWNKDLLGDRPKVLGQLAKYEQYLKRDGGVILDQYAKCVTSLNSLLGLSLPTPKMIRPAVTLLVFGYGSLNEKAVRSSVAKIRMGAVCIGNTESITQATLRSWLNR